MCVSGVSVCVWMFVFVPVCMCICVLIVDVWVFPCENNEEKGFMRKSLHLNHFLTFDLYLGFIVTFS